MVSTFNYQSVAFEKIVDIVVYDHDLSRHPLFQTMATLQADSPNRSGAAGHGDDTPAVRLGMVASSPT